MGHGGVRARDDRMILAYQTATLRCRPHWCQTCSSGIGLGPASLRRFKLLPRLLTVCGFVSVHFEGGVWGACARLESCGRKSRTEKQANYISRLERLHCSRTFSCMMHLCSNETEGRLPSLNPSPTRDIVEMGMMIFLGWHMEMRWPRVCNNEVDSRDPCDFLAWH